MREKKVTWQYWTINSNKASKQWRQSHVWWSASTIFGPPEVGGSVGMGVVGREGRNMLEVAREKWPVEPSHPKTDPNWGRGEGPVIGTAVGATWLNVTTGEKKYIIFASKVAVFAASLLARLMLIFAIFAKS